MKKPIIVLEQWKKAGYQNRLVTDGYSIRLEYLPRYDYKPEWTEDNFNPEYWLKVFTHK